MLKLKIKNPRTAQGMVEFALVLPVFLLLILGMIMVGHYLFTYSFVVSASREAARYGAAVGMADNGKYRFQDCDGIVEAATRVGRVAGVNPDNITVTYDKGPDTPSIGTCTPGNTGPGVSLGDRIAIEIDVPYDPIVPFFFFNTIHVRADTARTIVREITVGQAPDSDHTCLKSETRLTSSPRPSVVGQPITFSATVRSQSTGAAIPGSGDAVEILIVELEEVEETVDGVTVIKKVPVEELVCATSGGTCTAPIFRAANPHYITARFAGLYTIGSECYDASEHFNFEQRVNPAATEITFVSLPTPVDSGYLVPVTVRVTTKSPGAGNPTGRVDLYTEHSEYGRVWQCSATLQTDGTATCNIKPIRPSSGNNSITVRAEYIGDGNYQSSFIERQIRVDTPVATPTFITPVASPTVNPGGPTPDPTCPSLASAVNFNPNGSLQEFAFNVRNNKPADIFLQSITLNWPDLPAAALYEVRYAPNNMVGTDCKNNNNLCIWRAQNSSSIRYPTSTTLSPATSIWDGTLDRMSAGETRQMYFRFNHVLGNGPYKITLNFSNQCTLIIDAARNQ